MQTAAGIRGQAYKSRKVSHSLGACRCQDFPDLLSPEQYDRIRRIYGLTTREAEVLSLLCLGWSNQRIAEHLNIALPTLRCHVRAIYGKLGCQNRLEAVLTLIHEVILVSEHRP